MDQHQPANGDGNGAGATTHAPPAHPARPPNHDTHAHADIPKDLPKVTGRGVTIAAITIVAVFAILFFVGWLPHHRRLTELNRETTEATDTRPVVETTQPKRANPNIDLVLPADARAFQETAI